MQARSHRFLGPAGLVLLLATPACATPSTEHDLDTGVASTTQELEAGEESDEGRSPPPVAVPHVPQASPPDLIPGLTPELMAALELAHRVSDTADYDYEMALHGLRANARENSQRLREAVGRVPPEAHSVRQILISMIGSIGVTSDDAQLLERYALMPLAPRGLSGESPADAEERQITSWTALFSLARMRERPEASDASQPAVERVLGQASPRLARTLFLELEIISGIKSEVYRNILRRRGIDIAYTVPTEVTPLDVEPPLSNATTPPAATN